ncbi:MAG: CapA family protein, partial [Oscillospiraceae bacterium]
TKNPVGKKTVVKMVSVGDNLMHNTVYEQAKQRANGNGYDFTYAYKNVFDIIHNADIATVNQETVLSSLNPPSGYPMFNTPQEAADYLIKMGFDVVNHATNHVVDKQESGLKSTLEYWDKNPQIKVVGIYKDKADYENIRVIEKNGIKFSFLGMTESLNGLNLPKNTDLIIGRTNEDEIKNQIEKAKAVSDVVIVNVHWGSEYTHKQNNFQNNLAKNMAEWGADLIIGHHPHVIQPVEYITRNDGTKAVVAYSLGNFISSQDRAATMLGGMLETEFTKNETGKISITNVKFNPVINHYDRGRKNIRLYPLDIYTKELASQHGIRSKITGYNFTSAEQNFSYDYLKSIVNNTISSEFLK